VTRKLRNSTAHSLQQLRAVSSSYLAPPAGLGQQEPLPNKYNYTQLAEVKHFFPNTLVKQESAGC